MTVYDKDGVRVVVDDGAVDLYVEGNLAIGMTIDEFLAIAVAIAVAVGPLPEVGNA